MKFCAQCQEGNPDEAVFCHQCGSKFTEERVSAATEPPPTDEDQLWREFIGPNKTIVFSLKDGWSWDSGDRYYLEQFRRFGNRVNPAFALSWHWPAFMAPFLWFLYRKMYLYAAVYLVGPAIAFYITYDPFVSLVWQVIAGATANYLYFWHVRDHLKRLRDQVGINTPIPANLLRDAGGVQPYVFVLAVLIHLFLFLVILQGPPEEGVVPSEAPVSEGEPRFF